MIANIRLAQAVVWLALLSALAAIYPATALAHEGGPQLLLDAGQFAPGQSLEVRGANLGTDLVVRIELVAEGKVLPLGEVLCDGHGDFTQSFVLSEDLPAGTYTLQAVDPSVPGAQVVLASTQLDIRNAAWSQFVENGVLIAVGLLALVAMALGVGWVLRARQREGVARKQPDAHLR